MRERRPPAAKDAAAPLPFEVTIARGHRGGAEDAAAPPTPTTGRPPSVRQRRQARVRRVCTIGLTILAVGSVLALALAWWLDQPPAGALARVNGQFLTAAQVDREVLVNRVFAALASSNGNPAETRTAILERLIAQRLQAQVAAERSAPVSTSEMAAAIVDLGRLQHWTPAQLSAALARQGLTLTDLRTSLADIVLINRYVRDVVAPSAQSAAQATQLQNTWIGRLEATAKIERYGNPEGEQAPRPGATAPDFVAHDLTDRPVRLADLRGRPVLLNFWATWCQPCRIEMPTLVTMYNHPPGGPNPAGDLALLAIAINSAPDTVAAFRQEFGLRFPVLVDSDSHVLNLYRVGPIPTSFLIDRGGIIRWVQVGAWTPALLQEKLPLIE